MARDTQEGTVSVSAADIQAFAPEFAETDTALINLYLTMSAQFVDPVAFATVLDTATRLWVCHQLTLNVGQASGAAGPLTAESVGPVSRSYGNVSVLTSPADMDRSGYGRLLRQLSRVYCSRLAV